MVYGEYYNNNGINGKKERRNPGKERRWVLEDSTERGVMCEEPR